MSSVRKRGRRFGSEVILAGNKEAAAALKERAEREFCAVLFPLKEHISRGETLPGRAKEKMGRLRK